MPDLGCSAREEAVRKYLQGYPGAWEHPATRLKYTEYPTSTPMPRAYLSGRNTPQMTREEQQRKGPKGEQDEGQGCEEEGERGLLSDSKSKQYVDDGWERVVEARWEKGGRAKEKEGRVVRLEGDVVITPYLSEEEKILEDRV